MLYGIIFGFSDLQKILIEKGGEKPPFYLDLWAFKQHQMPS